MAAEQPSILGISFDGLAISGIVNEFLNVAWALRRGRYRVLFDLGYDITMGRTPRLAWTHFPSWIEPIRSLGPTGLPASYSREIVEEARAAVYDGKKISETAKYIDICQLLTTRLVETFRRQKVRFLIVENGTLPDNPLFTEALYKAIAEYGYDHNLEKHVFWRDHDLMWSAEPHLYGPYPYLGVRKPKEDPHISFVVATEWMRQRMNAWSPSVTIHVVGNRFSSPPVATTLQRSFRLNFNIPRDAYLVARCTRVVPQKSIERDLRLLDIIQRRLEESGNSRRIFLFVAGLTGEDPEEFERLQALEQSLSIAGQVVWGDGLLPFNTIMIDPEEEAAQFSIRDLLRESDLSSFLTTYDYEGFGNPPAESMAMNVPYISTTYELYDEVYGRKGAIAPLLSIYRESSSNDPIPDSFISWTLQALTNHEYRKEITTRNKVVFQRFFSIESLEEQLNAILPEDGNQ